jgi:hypothetical protein
VYIFIAIIGPLCGMPAIHVKPSNHLTYIRDTGHMEKNKNNFHALHKIKKVNTGSSISTEQERQHADAIVCALKSRTV